MIAVNRRRYMGAKVEEDLQTVLKKLGCIAYFPFSYDGDTTDVLYGLTFNTFNTSRIYWDSTKEMYYVNCLAQNPAAKFVVPSGTWSTGFGVMAKCELISGDSQVITPDWNDAAAGNWGLVIPENGGWSGTFINHPNRYYYQTRYLENEVTNQNSVISGTSFTTIGLGRNKRYASSGNIYIQHLLIFDRVVSFSEYSKIKSLIEQTYT